MSELRFITGSTPGTAASGKSYVYHNQGSLLVKDDAGVIHPAHTPRRNWLHNSGFWFAQRLDPPSVNTITAALGTNIGWGPDRWSVAWDTGNVTYQRIDTSGSPETGIRSRFYGKFVKTTTTGKMQISQRDQNSTLAPTTGDTASLRGNVVRVVFYLKSVTTNVTWRLGLMIGDTGAGGSWIANANGTDPTQWDATSYLTPIAGTADGCTISGNAATITGLSTTTWTRVSVAFTVPSTSTGQFYVRTALWSNSGLTAGDGICIAQPSITQSFEIPDWPHDSASVELARCQCFYAKTFAVDQKPVQNLGINTGELQGIVGKAGAVANAFQLYWATHFQMLRSSAIEATYNPAAANALVRDETANVDSGAISIASLGGNYWVVVIATGNAGSAVGNIIGVHLSIEADSP